MKHFLSTVCLISFSFACAGCMMVSYKETSAKSGPDEKAALIDLNKVKIGMSYQEVMGLLGPSTQTGYKVVDEKTQASEPVTVPNPYRQEMIRIDGAEYVVSFLYTGASNADG